MRSILRADRGRIVPALSAAKSNAFALALGVLTAVSLAGPARAASAAPDRPASTAPTVLHGSSSSTGPQKAKPRPGPSASASAPTVLRGKPPAPPPPKQEAAPACPDGTYYAAGLGCVVPIEPGYFGSYDYYDIPVIGLPVFVYRHPFHGVHRHGRQHFSGRSFRRPSRFRMHGAPGGRGAGLGRTFGHGGRR